MIEAIPNYSLKLEDGKYKQNPWKEITKKLIGLTCKENPYVWSGDIRTTASRIFIYCCFFILFYKIYSLGIYLL